MTLRRLMTRLDGSGQLIHAIPLLLQTGKQRELMPALDASLAIGDRILFCGRARARSIMRNGLDAPPLPERRLARLRRAIGVGAS